jgi:nucleotide-binding universal stress UspA family protein
MTGIVVGVDGSRDADEALRWAMHEGFVRDTEVKAIMSFAPGTCPDAVTDLAFEPGWHGPEAAACHLLQSAVNRVRDPRRPVAVVEQAVPAPADEVLLDEAGRADMLVIGRHGGSLGRRILMGSISASCLHHATMPVVVVRAGHLPVADDGPVVVGVDGSPASINALRWAAAEAKARGVPLRVVHAWSTVPVLYPGVYVGIDGLAMEKAAREILDDCLSQGVSADDGLTVDDRLVLGEPTRSLLDATTDAALLVVGSRGRGGFTDLLVGSVAHQCVHHAAVPVAVIPTR